MRYTRKNAERITETLAHALGFAYSELSYNTADKPALHVDYHYNYGGCRLLLIEAHSSKTSPYFSSTAPRLTPREYWQALYKMLDLVRLLKDKPSILRER